MSKAPKRYFEFEVDDQEIKCRLTTDSIKKLEKSLGKKLQDYLNELGDDVIGGFVNILWASQQPFLTGTAKFTKADAEDIFDKLIEDNKDIMDISDIMQGILRESGLIPKKKPEKEDDEDNEDEEVELDPNE